MPVPYVRLLPIAGFEVWPSATWSPAWATAWPWWRSRGWPWSWRTPRASARAWRPCCTPWRPAAAGHRQPRRAAATGRRAERPGDPAAPPRGAGVAAAGLRGRPALLPGRRGVADPRRTRLRRSEHPRSCLDRLRGRRDHRVLPGGPAPAPPAAPWRSAEPAAIRRRLLADGAVGQLPDHVQVAGVAGVLLEHVEQGPGQGWTRVVRAEAPADRGLVVEPRAGDDPPRPGALVEEQRLDVVGALLGADPPRVAGAALHPG